MTSERGMIDTIDYLNKRRRLNESQNMMEYIEKMLISPDITPLVVQHMIDVGVAFKPYHIQNIMSSPAFNMDIFKVFWNNVPDNSNNTVVFSVLASNYLSLEVVQFVLSNGYSLDSGITHRIYVYNRSQNKDNYATAVGTVLFHIIINKYTANYRSILQYLKDIGVNFNQVYREYTCKPDQRDGYKTGDLIEYLPPFIKGYSWAEYIVSSRQLSDYIDILPMDITLSNTAQQKICEIATSTDVIEYHIKNSKLNIDRHFNTLRHNREMTNAMMHSLVKKFDVISHVPDYKFPVSQSCSKCDRENENDKWY